MCYSDLRRSDRVGRRSASGGRMPLRGIRRCIRVAAVELVVRPGPDLIKTRLWAVGPTESADAARVWVGCPCVAFGAASVLRRSSSLFARAPTL